MKKHILLMVFTVSALGIQGQYWNDDGNTGITPGTNFLGTIEDDPLDIRTEDIHRFRLLPDATYTIGSFPTQVKNGSLLLSPEVDQFYTNGAPGPYSLLHLAAASDNAQQDSYRGWMNIGISLTGNADHSYIGLKAGALDNTDVVFHWSDNPGKFLKDRMRWIFTSGYNGSDQTGASSLEGLEAMRLFPVDNDNVNVGIGDWFAANFNDPTISEPTERLDVLDGRVRIRELPTNASEALDKVMVVDDDGVVKWRPFDDFLTPAAADCDWTVQNPNTSGPTVSHHVYTAVGSSDSCADASDHVGIGTTNPSQGKLTIVKTADRPSAAEYGLHLTMRSDADNTSQGIFVSNAPASGVSSPNVEGVVVQVENGDNLTQGLYALSRVLSGKYSELVRGVYGRGVLNGEADEVLAVQGRAEIHNAYRNAFGVHASVQNFSSGSDFSGSKMWGVFSKVQGRAGEVFGVRGESFLTSGDAPFVSRRFGVYGTVPGGLTNFQCGIYGKAANVGPSDPPLGEVGSWAGYFEGRVKITSNAYVNGNVLVTSDASLKTNVEDIPDALGLLGALAPKTYEFVPQEHPHMQLPVGRQWGLLAQELQEVLPALVERVHVPAEYDSTMVEIASATSHLAVNYIGLIPILIAAVQEQQGQLEAAASNEAELQDRIAAQEARGDELAARLDQLEQALALCCSRIDPSESPLAPEEDLKIDLGGDRLLRIDPNPFTDRTTIRYTLERGGRTMLLVNSSDGKQLQVLSEAVQQAGDYQEEWHTSHLAPGIYYVTLLLDGEPLVKRAVKVQ